MAMGTFLSKGRDLMNSPPLTPHVPCNVPAGTPENRGLRAPPGEWAAEGALLWLRVNCLPPLTTLVATQT